MQIPLGLLKHGLKKGEIKSPKYEVMTINDIKKITY